MRPLGPTLPGWSTVADAASSPRQALAGVVAGVGAAVGSYAVVLGWVFASAFWGLIRGPGYGVVVPRETDTTPHRGEWSGPKPALEAGESAFDVAGWLLFEAVGVPVRVTHWNGASKEGWLESFRVTAAYTGAGPLWTPLLAVGPVAALLAGGALAASLGRRHSGGTPTLHRAALRGATMVLGLVPVAALGAATCTETYELPETYPATVGPALEWAAVVAVALGVTLGAVGGAAWAFAVRRPSFAPTADGPDG